MTTTPTLDAVHDARHQLDLLREALQSEKRRLGFFVGAGCPLGIYDALDEKTLNYIPDVAGLTVAIAAALDSDTAQKAAWTKLQTACKTPTCAVPNVEHVLTQLRTICSLKGATTVDGMTGVDLGKLDQRICELIASTVGKALPPHTTSYNRFASWMSQVTRHYPVEIFTSNYDLLLEEALEGAAVAYFDGFVGSREPFFDLVAMEQDSVPQRWTRLWKLHGSVNWVKRPDGTVYRSNAPAKGQQLLIYPSHLKYEQSRRMPYLAMIDRLRAFFQESNPVLVLCGYSFADEHLNEVLLDGFRANRAAHCFALMFGDLKSSELAVTCAKKNSNLSVIARDGAVVATKFGGYKPIEPSAVTIGIESGANASKDPGSCQLGDFHYFGKFLEHQFGVRVAA